MKVAVLFHRLGPYHWARLAAAGQAMPVLAIELSAESRVYAWAKVEGQANFERVTLFPEGDSRTFPTAEFIHRLLRVLHEQRPSVVVIPGWSDRGALCSLQWCLRTGAPAVAMVESHATTMGRRVWWKESVKRQILSLCSSALVGGRAQADYAASLGMARERMFDGYDVVDNGYFAQKAKEIGNRKAEIRNQKGLPEKYFLASARFIEEKNLPRLLQAYARYRQLCQTTDDSGRRTEGRGQKTASDAPSSVLPPPSTAHSPQPTAPWSLVLLGDGPLRPQLETRIAELGLQTSVSLPGFKQYDELPVYYALAGAFVMPSVSEMWGLVVNEAMASGLPVLVSNRCGCAPDLVQEGVNGFTFDPLNVEQLAQLMFQISAFQPSRLSEFGDASRRIIAAWGPERFASGLKAAVDKALEVGPIKATLTQKLILKALLSR